MKIMIALAATLAAFASASIASASDRPGGHYEWQNRPVYGPNKSGLPSLVRVWVGNAADIASCDCAMMRDKATEAECMDMQNHGTNRSKG